MAVLLIVVSSPEERADFNQALRGTHHRLVYALDGEDGFDRFNEVRPDLVIAHLRAPRLDGAILCQLIRQQDQGQIPVLLATDRADGDAVIKRAASLGADDVLRLPIDKAALLATLERWTAARGTLPPIDQSFAAPTTQSKLPSLLPPQPRASMPATEDMPNSDMFTSVSTIPPLTDDPGSATADLMPNAGPVPGELGAPELIAPRIPFSELRDAPMPSLTDPAESGERSSSMLEEPMLPVGAIGRMGALEGDGATNRIAPDMLEELPRDATPSGEAPMANARGPARGRKGLDESQLGKRLVRRVQHVAKLLPELNLYQLLGVEPSATAEQLRASYFELALEFHPDRFLLLRSGDIKEKIYAIFRRVNEAYTILSDDRRRAAYDETTLGKPRAPSPARAERAASQPVEPAKAQDNRFEVHTQTPQAKRFVQLAHTAYRSEAYDDARLFLLMALGLEPQNSTIRRAMDEASRKRSRASFMAMSSRPSLPPEV